MRTPRLRLLSAILAVALFFTLLPVSALAEGGGSNANTGLTIGITGSTDSLNCWDVSNSISMKEVSPAVYEVTFENKSYKDIFGIVNCTPFVRQYGILFRKWGVFVCQRDNESTTERRR